MDLARGVVVVAGVGGVVVAARRWVSPRRAFHRVHHVELATRAMIGVVAGGAMSRQRCAAALMCSVVHPDPVVRRMVNREAR
jgi:hypothetical protein